MENNNIINISLLNDIEKQELLIFYNYLLYKKQFNVKQNIIPQTFYTPIIIDNYQKFDRDEIYEDR